MAESVDRTSKGENRVFTSIRQPEFWAKLDALLRRWGPLLLVIFAVCYYGQYYRSDLNLGGEGGTTAIIAMRMMEGQRPILDTYLGYNVLWFWPVVWLFEITGPNYIALRIYFFALCTLSAVLGFLIVRRATGQGWLAVGVGLLLATIPGMIFRNYMGLLPVLNAWALLHAFVWDARHVAVRWVRFAVAGFVLGATYLVRIDVGIFFTVIYAGLAVLYPFAVRGEFLRRSARVTAGVGLCVACLLAIHLPFYLHARNHGYEAAFVEQYPTMLKKILWEGSKVSAVENAPSSTRFVTMPASRRDGIIRIQNTKRNLAEIERQREIEARKAAEAGTRPRKTLSDLFKQESFYDAAFVIILHLPVLIAALIIVVAGPALLLAIILRKAALKEPALVSLVTLGAALTIFPQYFFFRPDTPHLSEFMIPFAVAMACASFYAIGRTIRSRSVAVGVPCVLFVGLCGTQEGLFFYHSYTKESAGTIEAARKRSYEVVADNGVRVLVRRREQPRFQGLYDTIVRYSEPDEWVVTFPYSPTINFMTNRRSYLYNLYVDNAAMPKNFFENAIADIQTKRPAVIVIDQRDINGTEESRFRNWAAPLYDFIRENYRRVGEDQDFDGNEIFVRPDKLPQQI